ncbi:MAG: hypothetical protein Q4E09_05340 [Eubacteriales bacterium]|nr:hypothetical protein [Eubacteriales bacterium]
MASYSYKCPNCGAPLSWDPGSGQVECEYCKSSFSVAEVEEFNKRAQAASEEKAREEAQRQAKVEEKLASKAEQEFTEGEVEDLASYHCDNCGAEVVTNPSTAASFCYYCHSPVILTNRLSGKFRPDKVLPFRISEKEAQNRFLKWAKKKRFVPKSFYSQAQLEKMTGIYLPVWLADVHSDVYFRGQGKNTRRMGVNREEISEYSIVREGEVESRQVAEVAFKEGDKISPEAFESVGNFQWNDLEDFSPAYLSGYFAEIWSVPADEAGKRAVQQVENLVHSSTMNDLQASYDTVKLYEDGVNSQLKDIDFVLAAAWVLSYRYNDDYYLYVLNGQTGQAFGELPIDRRKLRLHGAVVGLIVLVILLLISYFFFN